MNLISGWLMVIAVLLVLAFNDREREQYEREVGGES